MIISNLNIRTAGRRTEGSDHLRNILTRAYVYFLLSHVFAPRTERLRKKNVKKESLLLVF